MLRRRDECIAKQALKWTPHKSRHGSGSAFQFQAKDHSAEEVFFIIILTYDMDKEE